MYQYIPFVLMVVHVAVLIYFIIMSVRLVRAVEKIDDSLDRSYVRDYLRENNILVIVRTEDLSDKFEFPGLQQAFRSSEGQFSIYESP